MDPMVSVDMTKRKTPTNFFPKILNFTSSPTQYIINHSYAVKMSFYALLARTLSDLSGL